MLTEANDLSLNPLLSRSSRILTPSGVRIGYETYGEGPPLVLVHGGFSDHRSNWAYVKPLLAPHFTVFAIARRGRGATDVTTEHRLEDEMADVASFIQQVGAPVFLLGHSYGAHVALGAAALVPDLVRKLVLYEAPWPHVVDALRLDQFEAQARVGDWDGFATELFTGVYELPQEVLDGLRGTPDWAEVLADAPATRQDLCALSRYRFEPERYGTLSIPVLLQVGSKTPPSVSVTDALATVLPDAEIGDLPDQAHEGMTTAPEMYAMQVRRFLEA